MREKESTLNIVSHELIEGTGAKLVERKLSTVLSIVHLLLLLSVLLNVLLAWQVNKLKHDLIYIKSEMQLLVGTSVPIIEAKDIDDHPAKISYNDGTKPTVLYIFTPDCKWCNRNLLNLKALATQARDNYHIVGLSLSGNKLRDYAARKDLKIPIYYGAPLEITSAYKLGGTPQTIVISPEGRVLKNWTGAYTGDVQREIEKYFQIHLPGIEETGT